MYREKRHAGVDSDRQQERREWDHGGRKEQHQREAREHAPPGKSPVVRNLRAAGTDRQTRELRTHA